MQEAELKPSFKSITKTNFENRLKEKQFMKKIFSIITIMLLVTIIAQSGFAFEKKSQVGGQSGYKPGQNEPQEPTENPYQLIPMGSRITLNNVQWAQSAGEASRWNFHAEVVNTTNKVIPKGALVEATYSSTLPGYFQTNQGGKPTVKYSVVLKEALAANGTLFIGTVVFVTTKNPANIKCKAVYKKKK